MEIKLEEDTLQDESSIVDNPEIGTSAEVEQQNVESSQPIEESTKPLSDTSADIPNYDNEFDEISKSLDDMNNRVDDIDSHIAVIGNDIQSLDSSSVESSSSVFVPDDYYTTTKEMSVGTDFFLALIFGVLVSFIFVYGLK